MNNDQVNKFIAKHNDKSYREISELLNKKGFRTNADAVRNRCIRMKQRGIKIASRVKFQHPYENVRKDVPIEKQVEADYKSITANKKIKVGEQKYKQLLEQLALREKELEVYKATQEVVPHIIHPSSGGGSEATAVALLSDIHFEEHVKPETVNGLNEYNLAISRARLSKFFTNVVKLIKIFRKDITINHLFIACLGDMINGNIHEENLEVNQLEPTEAIIQVQNEIASGLQYILDNTDLQISVPCHSGNHGRITKQIRHATEQGNSLEYILYRNLQNHFALTNQSRIKFFISPAYYSIHDIAGFKIRFHHGHAIKYGGGIGGIFIPAFKSIAQWNKAQRVDLDCFAHFHQRKCGGNFVTNGSVVGYNPYAMSIKADFERPMQTFFLVDHQKREKSVECPVWLD